MNALFTYYSVNIGGLMKLRRRKKFRQKKSTRLKAIVRVRIIYDRTQHNTSIGVILMDY